MKSQPSVDDAIIDDVAGQVYIEQFALETFQRADNAIRANKASKYVPPLCLRPRLAI